MKSLKIIKLYVLLVIPLLLISFTIGDGKSEYNVPIRPISVSAADIDIDNDNDIIIGHKTIWGETNKSLSILENSNFGFFDIIDTTKSFCGTQHNIFAIEINNDNYPDLVTLYSDFTSGNAARYVRIYYNENGQFNNYTNFNLNNSEALTTINYGDINGDSHFDLVVISSSGQFWGVLYNDGSGNLSPPQYHNISDYYPSDIASGDLNDDGGDDIVIVGQKTEVYFSYSNGFQLLTLETNNFKGEVKIEDFDFDGRNDIVTFMRLYPYNYTLIKFYKNWGNNSILVKDSIVFQPLCDGMQVSDFNNDSLPDLLFYPSNHDNLLIFFNKGDFEFGDSLFIPMADYGETSRRSACADFDGNGFNDIVTLRSWGAPLPENVNILFNDGNGGFVENPITKTTSNIELQTSNLKCYPNPFRNEITISFTAKDNENIQLKVFDINGEPINTLINRKMQLGKHMCKWDGTDKYGKGVSSGIYIIKLVTGRQNQSCRAIYLK